MCALQIVNEYRTGCSACPAFTWPEVRVKQDLNQSTTATNSTERIRCAPIALTVLQPGEPLSTVLLGLAMVSAGVSLTVIGVYWANRNHRLIKATSKELSATILTGRPVCEMRSVVMTVLTWHH